MAKRIQNVLRVSLFKLYKQAGGDADMTSTSSEKTRFYETKRSMDEAIAALWRIIDEAKSFLEDPKSTPADKKTWAKILGDTISILNKVMQVRKGEGIKEETLTQLLEKIPERYAKEVRRFFKKSKIGFTKSATNGEKNVVDDIYEQARSLKYGDSIHITWIDASRSQNVDATKLPLPNHNVETRKPNLPRMFVTVQKGDCYHDPHLVVIVDRTDDHSFEIESIPLVLIKKIEKRVKAEMEAIIQQGFLKQLKSSRKKAKNAIRFRDGSTKILE